MYVCILISITQKNTLKSWKKYEICGSYLIYIDRTSTKISAGNSKIKLSALTLKVSDSFPHIFFGRLLFNQTSFHVSPILWQEIKKIKT